MLTERLLGMKNKCLPGCEKSFGLSHQRKEQDKHTFDWQGVIRNNVKALSLRQSISFLIRQFVRLLSM